RAAAAAGNRVQYAVEPIVRTAFTSPAIAPRGIAPVSPSPTPFIFSLPAAICAIFTPPPLGAAAFLYLYLPFAAVQFAGGRSNVAADEPPTSICSVTPATVGASPPAGSTIAASFACSWNYGLDVACSFVPTTGVSATDVTVVSPLTGSIVTKSCAPVVTSSPDKWP